MYKDRKLFLFFSRMFLGTVSFCLIHVPGSVVRIAEATGKDINNNWTTAQAFFDPSHGANELMTLPIL